MISVVTEDRLYNLPDYFLAERFLHYPHSIHNVRVKADYIFSIAIKLREAFPVEWKGSRQFRNEREMLSDRILHLVIIFPDHLNYQELHRPRSRNLYEYIFLPRLSSTVNSQK